MATPPDPPGRPGGAKTRCARGQRSGRRGERRRAASGGAAAAAPSEPTASAPPCRRYFPAFLDLRGVPALVVGGGPVAARKARELLRCGARVTAVAPDFGPACLRLRGLRRRRKFFAPADLRGQRWVVAATNDRELNARLAALARRRGVWINAAAPARSGNALIPAHARRGPLLAAVSSGGLAPALAAAWRRELARLLPRWAKEARRMAPWRERILREETEPARRRRRLRRAAGIIRRATGRTRRN